MKTKQPDPPRAVSKPIRLIFRRPLPFLLFFIAIVFIESSTHSLATEVQQRSEYAIKSVYLYNFLLFVKWPDTDSSLPEKTITIGIVGKDPFGNHFSEVEGKQVKSNSMRLTIRRFGAYNDGDDFRQCHLLYISNSEKDNIGKILSNVKGHPVLTVSDIDSFLDDGGMIKLVTHESKIRWEVNWTPVKLSCLQVSAQLFRSAVKVEKIPYSPELENENNHCP